MSKHYIRYDTTEEALTTINPENTILLENILLGGILIYQLRINISAPIIADTLILQYNGENYSGLKNVINIRNTTSENESAGMLELLINNDSDDSASLIQTTSCINDLNIAGITWKVENVTGTTSLYITSLGGTNNYELNIYAMLFRNENFSL